jgi:outer membrane lipoprotein SlyB
MKNRHLLLSSMISATVMLSACANTGKSYVPIVDTKDLDQVAYDKDLKECQALSEQASSTGKTAAKGLGAGAVVGGLLGLVGGGNSTDIAQAAGIGAVLGGVGGGAQGSGGQEAVIKNCLIGRGYRVLK